MSFTGQFVHQAARLLVRQVRRLATPLAENGPRFSLQITNHRFSRSSLSTWGTELFPSKIRFAFLEKRFNAFVFVFAREAQRE